MTKLTLPPKALTNCTGRGAEFGERQDAQHLRVIKIQHPFVGVFGEQGVEHGAGLLAVCGEHVTLPDVFGTLAAGQRLGVKGHMANQVERVKVLAKFLGDSVERQPLGLQFLNNGLLAFGHFPASEKIIQAGKAPFQRLSGKVAQGLGDQLAVLVQILNPLGNDERADSVHIHLAPLLRRRPRRIADDFFPFFVHRRIIIGRRDGVVLAGFVNLYRLTVEVRVGKMVGRARRDHHHHQTWARGGPVDTTGSARP